MNRLIRSSAVYLAIPVIATAAAALVRWLLDPWLGLHLPYITFFVAIIASGWIAGWRPAALAAVLGFVVSFQLFVPSDYGTGGLNAPFLVGVTLYMAASAMIVAMVEAMNQARRRAQRHEQLLQTTLASIGDAVLSTDTAGRVRFLNPVAERLTGWTRAQAAGRPLAEVLHLVNERTRDPIEDPVAQVLRAGAAIGLGSHTLMITHGDRVHLVEDSAAPIRDETGSVSGVVLVFHDISSRRQAELERNAAQEHVISTLESIPDAFVRIDRDWRIAYVNNQYEQRFGRQRGSRIGKLVWEEWPELLGTEADAKLRQAMAARETVEFETSYGGSTRWCALTVCPMDKGELAVFIHDVTDRRRAEEALRASEQRFRLAADAVSGIIYDYDVVHGTVERSTGLFDVLGYRPEEVPPSAAWWWEQIHPDDRRELAAHCSANALLAVGRGLHVYRARHKDGHFVYLSDRSLAVRDQHGQLVRQVGCSIDITALKDAENHLKEADRRKDEFLATLAHELRNPLAPISNAVQFLKVKAASEPPAAWGLGVIERQVKAMARLLDDLLDVSRISRNKLVLRQEPVELEAVLRQAIETSRPLIDMGGHELTVALPPEPVRLDADPLRLAQVFSNLLSNAAKYTPGGGHIRLTAAREEGQVMLSVCDDGIGIAADMLPRLFEIFSQAEPALERAQGGLGIGLSLVHGLVELHGGSIEARSDGPGHGSEFIVRLPLRAREGTTAADLGDTRQPEPAGCRILVADDNHDGADSMAMTLESIGHQVCVAYDGEQALALAAEHRPAALLLDIGMPKKNGYDLCREIRAQPWGRDALMVALTGWGQEDDRRRALEAGFDHHLVKPVDLDALSALLAAKQLKPH